MPRMRPAMRSGMEFFQGVEMLAGADELDRHAGDRLDRQPAPPRASQSNLVRITPSNSKRLVERLGAVDGVLAGHRVDHQIHLVGLTRRSMRKLAHQFGVDVQPAGRVEDDHVAPLALASFTAAWHRATGSVASRSAYTGKPSCWPITCNCWMAAGRCKSAATSIGWRPCSLDRLAQLAAGGRFAGPLQAAEHQHR